MNPDQRKPRVRRAVPVHRAEQTPLLVKGEKQMAGFKWLGESVQYVWDGVKRVFTPREEEPPEIGVQPFKGDVSQGDKQHS